MRIISGKFRGRRLKSFKADHIRPTTDRIKESIFNSLMGELEGAFVLDLYSGTGNLAIESISRGAKLVYVVEKSRKSMSIINANLEMLEITGQVKTHLTDVFTYLRQYGSEPFDIIFIDPPFTEKLADQTMESLCQSQVSRPGTKVIIESSSHEVIKDVYIGYKLLARKSFGDKNVSFFEKEH